MACLSGMIQLVGALSAITFIQVTGVEGLLGLGAALVLGAWALTSFPAGRAMDRRGRVPVLVAGFAGGALGAALVALAVTTKNAIPAVAGFALIGAASGVVNLSRTAAGDMYPIEHRARGIALVVFGSVFGAILGPAVFSPLFSGDGTATSTLAIAWLAGGAIMLIGMGVVSRARLPRPEPQTTPGEPDLDLPTAAAHGDDANRLASHSARTDGDGGRNPSGSDADDESGHGAETPIAELLRRPGVIPALVAAVASFAVMVAVMNLTGHVVESNGHARRDVFPVISAHIVGMFGLVLFVGQLIDRIGRPTALVGGLMLVALSCASLAWVTSIPATAVAMFGLGLGWSFSYVAATAQLSDATVPAERGRMLGFSDALSAGTGAVLALVGGLTLSAAGVAALGVGAAAIALAPVSYFAANAALRPARA